MKKSRKEIVAQFVNNRVMQYDGFSWEKRTSNQCKNVYYCYDAEKIHGNLKVLKKENDVEKEIFVELYKKKYITIKYEHKTKPIRNFNNYMETYFYENDCECYSIYSDKEFVECDEFYLIIKKNDLDKILKDTSGKKEFYAEFIQIKLHIKKLFQIYNKKEIFEKIDLLDNKLTDKIMDSFLYKAFINIEILHQFDEYLYDDDFIQIMSNFRIIYYLTLVFFLEKYFLSGKEHFMKYINELDSNELQDKINKYSELERENLYPIKHVLFGMFVHFLHETKILDELLEEK